MAHNLPEIGRSAQQALVLVGPMTGFQEEYDFEKRHAEAERILKKYPNRIPVICERALNSDIEEIDKNKYLVPIDLTVGQFAYVVRKRLHLKPETAIFILVNNTFPNTSLEIAALYEEHKSDDGFLYVTYSGETTYGW